MRGVPLQLYNIWIFFTFTIFFNLFRFFKDYLWSRTIEPSSLVMTQWQISQQYRFKLVKCCSSLKLNQLSCNDAIFPFNISLIALVLWVHTSYSIGQSSQHAVHGELVLTGKHHRHPMSHCYSFICHCITFREYILHRFVSQKVDIFFLSNRWFMLVYLKNPLNFFEETMALQNGVNSIQTSFLFVRTVH